MFINEKDADAACIMKEFNKSYIGSSREVWGNNIEERTDILNKKIPIDRRRILYTICFVLLGIIDFARHTVSLQGSGEGGKEREFIFLHLKDSI